MQGFNFRFYKHREKINTKKLYATTMINMTINEFSKEEVNYLKKDIKYLTQKNLIRKKF